MGIKNLMGSLTRDLFCWWHKQIPNAGSWYASDGDLFLLDRNEIICLLDYKYKEDSITFCEKILYKNLYNLNIPIYIIKNTVKIDNNIIRLNRKELEKRLYDLGIKTDDIKTIMEIDVERALKENTKNTMGKDLSVWSYTPENNVNGYSLMFVSDDYIGWEKELRERRKL
jgi:hypothetical protein